MSSTGVFSIPVALAAAPGEARVPLGIHDIPIGCYVIDSRGGTDVIVDCNAEFARIFDLDSPDEVIGQEMPSVHGSTARYGAFVERLRRAPNGLETIRETIRTRSGRVRKVEISCRLRTDAAGREIGRIGVIRDVTGEVKLTPQAAVHLGHSLHDYRTTLQRLKYSIIPALKALGRLDDGAVPGEGHVNRALMETLADELGWHLGAVRRKVPAHRRNEPAVRQLRRHRITVVRHRRQKTLYPLALRDLVAGETFTLLLAHPELFTDDEAERLCALAARLERTCCVDSLRSVQEAVVSIDHEVSVLHQFLSRWDRNQGKPAFYRVHDLVRTAIHEVAEYARARNLLIKRPETNYLMEVEVLERDMVRALVNVIHNAVKYTVFPARSESALVEVACREESGSAVIEVVNRGIGIHTDELESGVIFRMGARGRLAEQGFAGTGIGLADTWETVANARGQIHVTSEALALESSTGELLYETRVKIRLPITHRPAPDPTRNGRETEGPLD